MVRTTPIAFLVLAALGATACSSEPELRPLPLAAAAAALPGHDRGALEAELERLFGEPGRPRFKSVDTLTRRGCDPNAAAPLGLAPELQRDIALDNRERFFDALQRHERGDSASSSALPKSLQRALATSDDAALTIERWQPDLREAALMFASECATCHGAAGGGDGPLARELNPPPRDFRRGEFRYHPGGEGAVPQQIDLVGVLRRGIPGAGMPLFTRLGAARHSGLADWVRFLALRGAVEDAWLAELARSGAPPSSAWMDARYEDAWSRWAILLGPKALNEVAPSAMDAPALDAPPTSTNTPPR